MACSYEEEEEAAQILLDCILPSKFQSGQNVKPSPSKYYSRLAAALENGKFLAMPRCRILASDNFEEENFKHENLKKSLIIKGK